MSYINKTLIKDERIVSLFSIHKFHFILPVCMSFVIIGIPLLIKYMFTEYGLTNNRVVTKTGFISRSTEEMKLSKIETVEVKQSVLGRVLGYGNVIVSGTGSSYVVISRVANPLDVKKSIDNEMQ
jgi:uncharacterized membrane protein YdbT with pleckstrin-like domain